ncbi:hypothetical protein LCM08_06260 [Salipiger pacificus]|nr:hypothetical protein [Alloyangia pacifica]
MSKLLKHEWNDRNVDWNEGDLQTAIATTLRKLELAGAPFTFAADQNGASVHRTKAEASRAKAQGMRAGEPDMRLYFSEGRLTSIELKAKLTQVSDEQVRRHKELRALGHDVRLIRAVTPQDGVDEVLTIIRAIEPGVTDDQVEVARNRNHG